MYDIDIIQSSEVKPEKAFRIRFKTYLTQLICMAFSIFLLCHRDMKLDIRTRQSPSLGDV